MIDNTLIFSIFLIYTGAAILSTVALYFRQSILVAYMIVGIILGPWSLKLVNDAYIVQQIGDVGIIFLLFLLGLHLHPQNLLQMLRKTTLVAVISSLLFIAIGYTIAMISGFSQVESVVIGAAMMFSSTIIGLKLLPSSILNHQHVGEVMISVLLMQDLIAIVVLLLLHGATMDSFGLTDFGIIVISLPALLLFSYYFEKYILMRLFQRFEKVREYMFLLSIAWCLSMAQLGVVFGLTYEVGAFIAGVSIATSAISIYIAECLKPIRDFCLVLFFFSVGANFNLNYLPVVALPAMTLAVLLLVLKPIIFKYLLAYVGEVEEIAWEVGFRLGQISEFSLLVAYIAASSSLISESASYLIQAATMITFLASSYIVVYKYQTPMGLH
ncbi:MAG: cation:proton antiporter [Legionellales bacterium]|jgi:Kef-type K+ transport system membrane component KefB|nr:cation:proton antiporter [Legionellales bacterium]